MEFRIGEMTFDYELLFKRISHCNKIVHNIKMYMVNNEDFLNDIYHKKNQEFINKRLLKFDE